MTASSLLIPLLALLGVVGLILLIRRAVLLFPALRLPRLTGAVGAAGPLRIDQMIPLDSRRRLLLVRCGPRHVLLMTGGPQDLVVGWIDPHSENPETPP